MAEKFEDIKKLADVDMVNRPPHYNREGALECFDEFVLIYGIDAAKYACLFNVHKYRYRAADKNGEEDLKKSDWYMNKYRELCMESQTPEPMTPFNPFNSNIIDMPASQDNNN